MERRKAATITIIPATGANAQAVAEYVIAAAMVLLRGVYGSTRAVVDGEWPRAALSNGRELSGKTLGLIGFGSIGRVTGRIARLLGMRVVGFDANLPTTSPVWADEATTGQTLDQLLAEADVVSLHVPLTPETRNLIDVANLAKMKPDAILINTARGGVVDEAAVANSLRVGKLGGAALDVFDHEPLAAGSPFAHCPNLLLTPHIAGGSRKGVLEEIGVILSNARAVLAGQPVRCPVSAG